MTVFVNTQDSLPKNRIAVDVLPGDTGHMLMAMVHYELELSPPSWDLWRWVLPRKGHGKGGGRGRLVQLDPANPLSDENIKAGDTLLYGDLDEGPA